MNSEKLHVQMGRREDFRFVTGQGCYTADMVPDNALHAVFVRSPIARGHLRHLSVDMARAAPDVVAVLTAQMRPPKTVWPIWCGLARQFVMMAWPGLIVRARY